MISIEQARNIIYSQTSDWGAHHVPVAESIGEILAEDIYADRDFPPFDRVAMDGIALSYDAVVSGETEYQVQGMQLAGEPALTLEDQSQAIEIMTGAVLSTGCDLVIRYEDLDFFEKQGVKWVRLNIEKAERYKNVHRQGQDQSIGELLIQKGIKITAAEVAIMATVGCVEVLVKRKPKVAIISTGDELVDVSATPLPYQIRKSNSISIQATLNQLRIPCELFHLQDDKLQLENHIRQLLEDFDVLLLSGGVSKGKADYLPEVLEAMGVNKLFHRVAQRPGKPFWFGSHPEGVQVFAFPGNPISTFMCFRIYFLPWLMKNLGVELIQQRAVLMEDFTFRPTIGYFLQVRSDIQSHKIHVYPQVGGGSGDLANLTLSDAFIYLPAEAEIYKAKSDFDYFSFDVSSLA